MTAAKPAPGQGPKLTVIDNAPAGSPGQRLSRARSQRNLSHEDVAKHLNLSVSMVKAIESDNFKSLPGRAFVKGYLRNYGKLVGIAPDELVKAFESQFANNEEVVLTPPPVARPLRWVAPLIKGVGYLLALAVVALIGSLIYQNAGTLVQKASQIASSFHRSDTPATPSAETPREAEEVSDTSTPGTVKLAIPLRSVESPQQGAPIDNGNAVGERPSIGEETPSSERPSSERKDGNDAVPMVTPQSSSDNGALVNSPVEAAAPSTAVAASAASLQSAVTSVDKSAAAGPSNGATVAATVDMAFSRSSYVEIKDARGKYLFKGLKTGGSDLQLQGKPPLKVLVGYGPGVKVSFNGKPHEFSVSAGNNVAQFTLGDE